ncbi:hypothetical protein APJL_0809 [Actinobacillus pleuropneumoniae serovar 3 str. JL03]|uniref:Uncharacterized protein n=1 Tax=Actinobacillus pleuropneumoniae serotype 3 (strain JL03) TaxID=434271 RepID=B0BP84_ACTPJ|nr:hypothetical protein APJL_0809 [Actinobacillus pleuropneumoniae serovar 3 str. JL03]
MSIVAILGNKFRIQKAKLLKGSLVSRRDKKFYSLCLSKG